MVQIRKFELNGKYLESKLSEFGVALIDLINIASQVNNIELSSLVFKTGVLLDSYENLTLEELVTFKIPIFDYIIYQNLTTEDKMTVRWNLDNNRRDYSETEVCYSILYIYFMVMTRNKVGLNENEEIPSFLIKFMKIRMLKSEIKNVMSNNDLDMFNHYWVKEIDVNQLSLPLKNRLKQGIAGMRLFSIFKDYEITKPINERTSYLIDNLKRLAEEGPYWEMHTLFQNDLIRSIPITANLLNLILYVYTEEQIKTMVSNRSLYRFPSFNPRAVHFNQWDEEFFNSFKTKLFKEIG